MTDVTEDTNVQSLGDAIDEAASGMMGTLEEPLRTKCRYLYLNARIEAIQNRGGRPSETMKEKYEDLEERLKKQGVEPSFVLYRINQ